MANFRMFVHFHFRLAAILAGATRDRRLRAVTGGDPRYWWCARAGLNVAAGRAGTGGGRKSALVAAWTADPASIDQRIQPIPAAGQRRDCLDAVGLSATSPMTS
jgi:hypothetical protein